DEDEVAVHRQRLMVADGYAHLRLDDVGALGLDGRVEVQVLDAGGAEGLAVEQLEVPAADDLGQAGARHERAAEGGVILVAGAERDVDDEVLPDELREGGEVAVVDVAAAVEIGLKAGDGGVVEARVVPGALDAAEHAQGLAEVPRGGQRAYQ